MNTCIFMGRLTRDPETKRSEVAGRETVVSRFTLAVPHPYKKEDVYFINFVAFGNNGTFAEKYLKQGTKILVKGYLATGSYTNKEGVKVYTSDIIVDTMEFAEKKAAETTTEAPVKTSTEANGFTPVDANTGFFSADAQQGLEFN